MKRIFKWLGIILGGLVGIILLALIAVYALSGIRINRSYNIPLAEIIVPTGDEAIAAGEHIATIRGCTDCHASDLGGKALIEDPMVGNFYPTNLTAGQGGVLGNYNDAQLARAVRHGVGYDNKPLLFMPAHEFYVLSDEDVGAIIAYIRAQPPVNREWSDSRPGLLGRVLFLAGEFPLLPVELIDHELSRPPAPPAGVTVEYGAYLSVGCQGCHQSDFSGGPIPGTPPDFAPAANLTPAGDLAGWTEAEFMTTMRAGVRPDGRTLDPLMPVAQFSRMTDDELKAIWLYLQSLPPQ